MATEQTEQQSSRATGHSAGHSAGHVIPRSAAWELVVASVVAYRNLLPEAL
jgi:hypothetical protein